MHMFRLADLDLRQILCAVDPYQDELSMEHLARAVSQVLQQGSGRVEAAYVLNPSDSFLPLELFEKWAEEYQVEAEQALKTKLASVAFPITPQFKVLLEKAAPVYSAADRFALHAKHHHFGLIAVHSHGRSGLLRYVLGSFAESLLASSEVPLLMLNPATNIVDTCDTVFLPTSFSEKAKRGLSVATAFAKTTGARLLIYHHLVNPPTWALKDATREAFASHRDKLVTFLQQTGEQWTRWAHEQGVQAELIFEEGGIVSAGTILAASQAAKAKVIALFPEDAPTERAIFGTVAREVTRRAKVPVLALRV